MRRPAAFLALCLALLLAAPVQAQEFVSTEGRFKVVMPGTPRVSVVRDTTVGGKEADSHQFAVSLSPQEGYVVMYSQLPPPQDKLPPARLLQMAFDEATGGKVVLSDRNTTIGGMPARVFRFRDGPLIYDMKVAVAFERLYHVFASVPASRTDSAELKRFLESFSFVN